MKRCGRVIKIKPEKLEYYKDLHAHPWPEVTAAIAACNIRNFSIYYHDGYLFSYYEYDGDDYDCDMKRLGELTQRWLEETDKCQQPLDTARPGEWWADMVELFHQD